YVERRRPFWWDRVSFVVKSSPRERLVLAYPAREELSLNGPEARRAAVRRAERIIKDTVGLDLDRFIDELERAADVVLSAVEQRKMADATVMTWEEITALRRAGMDVQSHSHTHRVLQTLDARSLERELFQSRAALEDALGERPQAIAYPVGRPLGRAAYLRRAVTDAGYRLGFSNATGVSYFRAIDPLNVRRISLDRSIRDPFFRAMLALPMLAY
ncbi:MAG: polysaccharide deacetylase family protein, partial [Polyangiaceae bacterium]